jgi:hypothetical protein
VTKYVCQRKYAHIKAFHPTEAARLSRNAEALKVAPLPRGAKATWTCPLCPWGLRPCSLQQQRASTREKRTAPRSTRVLPALHSDCRGTAQPRPGWRRETLDKLAAWPLSREAMWGGHRLITLLVPTPGDKLRRSRGEVACTMCRRTAKSVTLIRRIPCGSALVTQAHQRQRRQRVAKLEAVRPPAGEKELYRSAIEFLRVPFPTAARQQEQTQDGNRHRFVDVQVPGLRGARRSPTALKVCTQCGRTTTTVPSALRALQQRPCGSGSGYLTGSHDKRRQDFIAKLKRLRRDAPRGQRHLVDEALRALAVPLTGKRPDRAVLMALPAELVNSFGPCKRPAAANRAPRDTDSILTSVSRAGSASAWSPGRGTRRT